MLRNSFLWMSQNRSLRRWMESSSTAHALTSRFIAGLSLEDGISLAKTLGDQGIQTALDHLGENVGTVQEAKAAGAAALGALSSLAQLSIGGTVAIKLTQLGLDLSMEEGIANLEPLVMLAKQAGTRVEVDMESSAYTDRTLQIVEAMHLKHGEMASYVKCEETMTLTNYAERLAFVRAAMADQALDGFILPRADEHLGEYVLVDFVSRRTKSVS